MHEFDLVIRGGTVVTAADTTRADVGVRDGRIIAIAEKLVDGGEGDRRIRPARAAGRRRQSRAILRSLRGHRSWPTVSKAEPAPRSREETPRSCRSRCKPAAPRCAPPCRIITRLPTGKALCDYGFHLIVTDPTPSVLGQELPALVEDGYTSFKVFMTYDDMVLNDKQLLEVFDCARGCGALVMVHCEGYDAIRFMTIDLKPRERQRLTSMASPGQIWSSARRRTAPSATRNSSTSRS